MGNCDEGGGRGQAQGQQRSKSGVGVGWWGRARPWPPTEVGGLELRRSLRVVGVGAVGEGGRSLLLQEYLYYLRFYSKQVLLS